MVTNINQIKKMLRNKQYGENITIPKWLMPEIPPEFEITILGDPEGAYCQYRAYPNLHLLEYYNKYRIHKDQFDPRKQLLKHAVKESPETLVAAGAGVTSGAAVAKMIYEKRKYESDNADLEAAAGGAAAAILVGIGTYYLGKKLRKGR